MTVVPPAIPPRSVFRRSQDRKLELEHRVDGIEPLRAGFEVSDKVCRDDGRELGGEAKLLFVMYLRCQLLVLKAQEMTAYRVWRDVVWMRDGTVPSKLLKDRSLMRQLGRLRSKNSSLQISQRRRECIKVGIFESLTSDHPVYQLESPTR
jgi:hypothetical protein